MLRTVVIVEDTDSVACSLALALEAIPGVRTIIVSHPRAALRLFTGEPRISALITDLDLPALDGFELIGEIRKLPGYQHLPVLMVTAEENARMPEAPAARRPDAIVLKPFSPKEVRRVLELLLQ